MDWFLLFQNDIADAIFNFLSTLPNVGKFICYFIIIITHHLSKNNLQVLFVCD